jgi:2-C-methyl-D-erythritol 4-phosphate cytidylyltransferase
MAPDTAVVVLAAGRGRRLGRGNKALLPLGGEPLVAHALRAARGAACVREVVLVMMPEDVAALAETWGRTPAELGAARVVAGGAERWLSSRAGCAATEEASAVVLVHDAARALVTPALFEAVAAAARERGAALAAAPVADTLKRADAEGRVAATVDREALWAAQTPQGARRELLLAAFAAWPEDAGLPTDEAMLLEAAGHAPTLVVSPAPNPKVTTPADLDLAAALLEARSAS